MHSEGAHSILNETELKKRFLIKECKVVLVPIVVNKAHSLSQSKINPVSESMSQISTRSEMELRNKRRKSTTMKSVNLGRGRRKSQGTSRRSPPSRKEDLVNEIGSNSDNSVESPLYNEINWEENLECESSLVDAFAPRVQNDQSECEQREEDRVTFEGRDQLDLLAKIEEDNSNFIEKKMEIGTCIFVCGKYTNEDPRWLAAVVLDIDEHDQEVLVRYTDGKDPPPDEWIELATRRITLEKPETEKEEPALHNPLLVNLHPEPNSEMEVTEMNGNASVSEDPPPEETMAQLVKTHSPSPPSQSRRSWKRGRGGRRGRGGKREHHKALAETNSKFVEGEKVLAKWSEHRMQKFPAIVKTVLANGTYDVLFYDGFEKTINEEHLFKTNEEEIEKYQHMNPSEADSFHHMDLDSKEARRERKKKTFDDYVFAKEIRSKRRSIKSTEKFSLPKKIEKITIKTEAECKEKEGEEVEKPFRQKKMRKRRRALFGPKRDNSRVKLHMLDLQRTQAESSRDESEEAEGFYGFDMAEAPQPLVVIKKEPIDEPPETMPLSPPMIAEPPLPPPPVSPAPPEKITAPPPVVIKSDPIDERWRPNENQQYNPIDIDRNGVIRKSTVVPDNYLPPGWSKHAIVSTTNNIWDVILVSPDGYQINNANELKHYFATIVPNGGVAPPYLDFSADFNVLAELALKQKESPVTSTIRKVNISPASPRTWSRRRGGRTRGRGMPGRGRPPGVRTLLPKQRVEPTPPQPALPPVTPSPSASIAENELRCPKESCDKKFRKESLLQMHIKHYHSELSALVRSVPNMVDLACARSESVNSEFPKILPSSVKKMLPRACPPTPVITEEPTSRTEQLVETSPSISSPGTSRIPERSPITETPSMKRLSNEERRSTIKTMLPIRPTEKNVADSDDFESEDDYIEQKKNGSRIFKPGKYRKGKYVTGSRGNDNMESGPNQLLPTYKLTRKRKNYKIHNSSDSFENIQDEEKQVTEDGIVIERMKAEEFINCICGFREEDGLMIQCDICMCWQHGLCAEIEHESDVPDRYVCSICRSPFRVRSSKKYSYAHHYLTQGKLPTFSFRTRNEDEIARREMMLKRCYELTANIHEIKRIDRSLSAKLNIAEKADHPKLYMWAKNWEDSETKNSDKIPKTEPPEENESESQPTTSNQPTGPQPEPRIDLEDCRIRLLDHVDSCYSQIEDRLTSIQTQIAALESLDPDLSSSSSSDKVTKQTIQLLLKDLETLSKLAAIS